MQEAAGSQEKNTLDVYLSPEALRELVPKLRLQKTTTPRSLWVAGLEEASEKGWSPGGEKSLADSMVLSGGTTWAAVDGSAF